MTYQRLDERLIKEWNWKKNVDLDPRNLNVPAKTKLWWICESGHEWPARLDHRKRGAGCPYDSGHRLLPNNSLAITHPEIAAEWHQHKNGKITPQDVSRATTKVYWWKCEKGYEWPASVSNRTRRGDRCPYCSGKIATSETCLQARNPELAKEWNFDKNGSLTPYTVTLMSNKRVWWICEDGHEWKDKVSARATGNRCKVCYPRKPKQKVSNNYNLKTINPRLIDEWHPTKNKGLNPAIVSPGSGKKVWWLCRFCGHEWKASIDNRNGKNRGCPKCNAGNSSSFHEQCILFYLRKILPDCENRYLLTVDDGKSIEIDIFIPSLNIGIEYDGYFYHKNRAKQDEHKNHILQKRGIKLIRIRENNGNDKMLPLIQRFDSIEIQCKADDGKSLTNVIKELIIYIELLAYLEGTNLTPLIKNVKINIKEDNLEILSNAKKNEKERSLGLLFPEIASEWHKEKNQKLTPWNFTPGSDKRVWWTCKTCSMDWNAIIIKRVNGQTCPYCSGQKAGPVRSLEKECPQIAAMWHPTKNGELTPQDVLPGSNLMASWFCSKCNQDWEEPVYRRTSKKGCPYCNGKRVYQGNCLATIKPEIAKLWHPTMNGKLTPYDVTSCSGKLVWWKCGCGNEFQKQVHKMKEKCNICK